VQGGGKRREWSGIGQVYAWSVPSEPTYYFERKQEAQRLSHGVQILTYEVGSVDLHQSSSALRVLFVQSAPVRDASTASAWTGHVGTTARFLLNYQRWRVGTLAGRKVAVAVAFGGKAHMTNGTESVAF